jgi:hypothetical protein
MLLVNTIHSAERMASGVVAPEPEMV